MINSYFKAGKLVKEASSEVKMCRPDIKVTEVLIAKGIVGSAPRSAESGKDKRRTSSVMSV